MRECKLLFPPLDRSERRNTFLALAAPNKKCRAHAHNMRMRIETIYCLSRDRGRRGDERRIKEHCHIQRERGCSYIFMPAANNSRCRRIIAFARSLARTHDYCEQSAPRCTCEMRVLCLWKEACREIRVEYKFNEFSTRANLFICERRFIIAGAPPTLAMCHAALINLSCMPIVCRTTLLYATALPLCCAFHRHVLFVLLNELKHQNGFEFANMRNYSAQRNGSSEVL